MQDFGELDFEKTGQAIIDLVTAWGLKVLGALAVLVIGWWVAALVRRSVRKALERTKLDPTLIPFTTGMAFVVIAVLGIFGIPTTSLIAVLGAAGLAVGLALQGTLTNFAAGIMLLILRPFRVGHYVEIGGTGGAVEEIGIFSTTLNTPDNIRITVPNGSVFGQTIRNYSANDTRRNDIVIGVSYGDNLGMASDVIQKIIDADSRVLSEPPPLVAVSELGDSSVNFVVRPWCKTADYWPLRFDLLRKLKEELEAAGCSIPFPQTDVHLFQEQDTSAA